ncbi:MAG: hypothetical protein ABI276_02150 [Acidimicrobiales bacterium]
MGGPAHLTKRFFGSLVPFGPSPADAAWAERQLLDAEVPIWRSMSRADRRHASGVARRVDAALGDETTRPVIAAALLHDSGKVASGLGTFGRVGVTLLAAVIGRERVASWSARDGIRGHASRYIRHPEIGAAALRDADSDPLTTTWAAEHHLPPTAWTVPRRIGDILHAADDD